MTRLKSEDIRSLAAELGDYDRILRRKTGCCLAEIAQKAAGLMLLPRRPISNQSRRPSFRYPGEKGLIPGFAEKEIVPGRRQRASFRPEPSLEADPRK